MAELTRRSVLAMGAAGAVTLLAGCAPTRPQPSPSATPTARRPDWAALERSVTGPLLRPGDTGYGRAKLTENPAYDAARPLAVLTVASAADVQAALRFAGRYDVPLAIRSGGHSYTGFSSGGAPGTGMPASLVIDTRNLAQVTLNGDRSATIGAGAPLSLVYGGLGDAGRAIAAGSCATVGVSGLTLGGGVGVMTRAYGLTCDALKSVEIVTADGTIRHVDANNDSDLFWACRGGGGGHLGVVTALTFATVRAPQVTMFALSWPIEQAAAVIDAWQNWAPTADPKLWSTLKILGGSRHPDTLGLSVSGTWLGDESGLDAHVAPFFDAVGSRPASQSAGTHTYRDAMMRYAGCAGVALDACNTGPGGALTREPFANTSHVAYDRLDAAGIDDLLAQAQAAQKVDGMVEGGVSLDALGGAAASVSPDATAFVHRKALATVQYTSTFDTGAAADPYFAYVRGFREAMRPHWGDWAYVNYADARIDDPATAYFGDNAPQLAAVASKYDPEGLFTQPQGY
ncbi:FAD-binding oxidoreductase [Microbacterium sp. STN6]|uniref:FAD-binding oxidoreductase n=1 Tax=Microbacterium sp. STN6 TaxID=2995588 RepID=UPI002260A84D|nr:FAD-binding oxidoreductase [Microbacterium sp. STN6]MCX7522663.1 FAD-binding oxidoreductase [Microbacterium sp. STN6]